MAEEFKLIKVSKIVPENSAVSSDDGEIIFNLIVGAIKSGEKISLDFSEINFITTAFLNSAIGQLYSIYTSDQLNSFLKLINVAEEDRILFVRVISRAKEYFANRKGFEGSANTAMYDN